MAIYVNGIKIAGRGISGKSPYQVAVESGFKGTEKEFNDSLAAVGAAAEGFLELQQTVNNATTEINNAVNNARTEITILVNQANDAAENAQEIVDEAIADINRAKEDAINSIPNGD